MPKIPHGSTVDERRRYAGDIRRVATYFYAQGRWMPNPFVSSGGVVRLVEVWELGAKVFIHPSRNPFFWVQDLQEKKRLHALATDPSWMLTFQSGSQVLHRRGRVAGAIGHAKPLAAQAWAREDSVIGYTSPARIQWVGERPSFDQLESFPSVYYKDGHATIDHRARGNIGWENFAGWKCLFFGNVPRQYVE